MQYFKTLQNDKPKTGFLDAPVRMEEISILKEPYAKSVFGRIRFKSQTDKPIIAVIVRIYAKNIAKEELPLDEPRFIYQDMNISPGEEFGEEIPLPLPANSRSLQAILEKVVFDDETVWDSTGAEEVKLLPQKKIEIPEEYLRKFQKRISGKFSSLKDIDLYYAEGDSFWQCTCGNALSDPVETCPSCGNDRQPQKTFLSEEGLADTIKEIENELEEEKVQQEQLKRLPSTALEDLETERRKLDLEKEAFAQEIEGFAREKEGFAQEKARFAQEKEGFAQIKEAFSQEQSAFALERDTFFQQRKTFEQERDHFEQDKNAFAETKSALEEEKRKIVAVKALLAKKAASLASLTAAPTEKEEPETAEKVRPEDLSGMQTIPEPIPETIQETIPETIQKTISLEDTIPVVETVPEEETSRELDAALARTQAESSEAKTLEDTEDAEETEPADSHEYEEEDELDDFLDEDLDEAEALLAKSKRRKKSGGILKVFISLAFIAAAITGGFFGFQYYQQFTETAQRYQEAKDLLDAGQLDSAIDIFFTLAGYRDSEALCNQAIEMRNQKNYDAAYADYEAGSYESAITKWENLGDYKNSKEMIEEARAAMQKDSEETKKTEEIVQDLLDEGVEGNEEEVYNEAAAALERGDYQLAIEMWDTIQDYKDSADMIERAAAEWLLSDASSEDIPMVEEQY